ncbi:MAG: hypothetical protein NVSMB65_19960 [Chloroflexota bacterium]
MATLTLRGPSIAPARIPYPPPAFPVTIPPARAACSPSHMTRGAADNQGHTQGP